MVQPPALDSQEAAEDHPEVAVSEPRYLARTVSLREETAVQIAFEDFLHNLEAARSVSEAVTEVRAETISEAALWRPDF